MNIAKKSVSKLHNAFKFKLASSSIIYSVPYLVKVFFNKIRRWQRFCLKCVISFINEYALEYIIIDSNIHYRYLKEAISLSK